MAKLLIAQGADVNAKNSDGQTPLDIALSRNRKDIVELLLAKGATISSIHVAAQMGDLAGAKTLIEQGADSHHWPLSDFAKRHLPKGILWTADWLPLSCFRFPPSVFWLSALA